MSKYQRKELVLCTCGFITTIGNINRHIKSKHHQQRLRHYYNPVDIPKNKIRYINRS